MDTLVNPFSEPNAILKNNKNIFEKGNHTCGI